MDPLSPPASVQALDLGQGSSFIWATVASSATKVTRLKRLLRLSVSLKLLFPVAVVFDPGESARLFFFSLE